MLRRTVRLELAKSKKTYRDVFNNSPMPMLRLLGETIEITVLPLRESNQDVVKKPIPMIIPDLDKTQKKQEEKLRISKIRLIESI